MAPDHKFIADTLDSFGVKGFAELVADLARRHQRRLQNLSLDQLPGLQLAVQLLDQRVGDALLAHHQGGIELICLCAELCALLACDHFSSSSIASKRIKAFALYLGSEKVAEYNATSSKNTDKIKDVEYAVGGIACYGNAGKGVKLVAKYETDKDSVIGKLEAEEIEE